MSALFLFLGTTFIVAADSAAESDSTEFYYFNPDSSQSNLARLKREMDTFLSKSNSAVKFQPFARYHDFHRKMRESIPAFVFMPEWYLQQNKDRFHLKPLLQPVRNNLSTYRKILLTSKESQVSLHDLRDKTIALTSMGPATPDLLNKLIFSHYNLDSNLFNIIITPKDSDALFALAVRQVDVALVSQDNLQRIGRINPRILQLVRPLAESQPIPLPVLCAGDDVVPKEKILKIKKIFLDAKRSKDSANLMEMLQIDAWHNYSL
ncbi:MAG: hypothetical protein D3924_01975 [Candidatus Electrothrix sp. AR4]|nr:hypothetical protein [Candidatus Electrothrix sp. AR4]